ncbi:MAG: hypothetical protein M0R03_16820 [Novosphingobium sp.]|nr:hypothetical protein [Novosphingobium sp.]
MSNNKIKILIVDQPHSNIAKALQEHILTSKINAEIIVDPNFDSKILEQEYSLDNFLKTVKSNKKEVDSWPLWKKNIVINAESAKTGKFIKDNKNDK